MLLNLPSQSSVGICFHYSVGHFSVGLM